MYASVNSAAFVVLVNDDDDDDDEGRINFSMALSPVSYTHLTLPTNREV